MNYCWSDVATRRENTAALANLSIVQLHKTVKTNNRNISERAELVGGEHERAFLREVMAQRVAECFAIAEVNELVGG